MCKIVSQWLSVGCATPSSMTVETRLANSHRVEAACSKRCRVSLVTRLGKEPNLVRLSSHAVYRLGLGVNGIIHNNLNQTYDGYSGGLYN